MIVSIVNPAPHHVPRSAYDRVGGLVYFARMLDKIRLHRDGRLRTDFHANLCAVFDARCCCLLGINYAALRDRAVEGGNDVELLGWCHEHGSAPTNEQVLVWNMFMEKRGWRDEDDGSTQELEHYKAGSGLAHRTDLVTFFDYYDVDEGRRL